MVTRRCAFGLLLILNLLIVYSNHFSNDFQFDDINAIPNNPAIREPATIVRAFVDANLFSSAPEQRTYRPVTTASLALDYWLAGGLHVFVFHLSTFLWYSLQLALMWLLFERLMNMADPHPSNFWTALAAAAAFGLLPANAETINYIIQRADVYNALGCIASLWLFIRYPSQRRFGWYLLPVALAMLAKPPALVFPVLLLAYVLLFEQQGVPALRKWRAAAGAALPSLAVACAVAFLLHLMQPKTWASGSASPGLYRLTQPFVALHYFKSFFLPTNLNIDHGWHSLAPLGAPALAGDLFVLGLLAVTFAACRTRAGKPVAFGILWFLVTLLPTSLVALADVTNDHRMFFSFVGLTLAVIWSLRLALFRWTARLTRHRRLVDGAIAALATVLIVAGVATRVRNRVWLTPKSLWSDSVAKNPHNTRALTNYGNVAYSQADYETALSYWDRAAAINPTCHGCQSNLVRVSLKLHRDDLTERYYRRILELYPSITEAYTAYADWLGSVGRFDEGVLLLDRARKFNPQSQDLKLARTQLMARRNAADRILLIRVLDSDHDTRLSAAEMIAAPAALLTLDRNGDGKLTAEECGANLGISRLPAAEAQKARRLFMRSNPVLLALDANHDGEISPSEIRNAEQELAQLDRDRNGSIETTEMVPGFVTAAVHRLLARLDLNRNGTIESSELNRTPLHSPLIAADIDGDGVVTFEELTNEILYRAGRHKDGVVTQEDLDSAMPSYSVAPIPVSVNRRLTGRNIPPFIMGGLL